MQKTIPVVYSKVLNKTANEKKELLDARNISKDLFKYVCHLHNKIVMDDVIDNAEIVQVPLLGRIFVYKRTNRHHKTKEKYKYMGWNRKELGEITSPYTYMFRFVLNKASKLKLRASQANRRRLFHVAQKINRYEHPDNFLHETEIFPKIVRIRIASKFKKKFKPKKEPCKV